jgi:hypothetical protein
MAEGPIPDPTKLPKGKAGAGLLKNLNPKQKRMLAVVGVGAFLALIFLLSRRSAPAGAEAGEPIAAAQPDEGFGAPVAAGGTDPTAFLGAQSEVVGSRLEEVSGGLQEVGLGLGEVGQGLGEVERGQDDLGRTFMEGQERDETEFGRVHDGLAGQSRQLTAIRKKLAAGRSKKPGKKAKNANSRKPPRGKRGGGKPPRGKGRKNKPPRSKPPRNKPRNKNRQKKNRRR